MRAGDFLQDSWYQLPTTGTIKAGVCGAPPTPEAENGAVGHAGNDAGGQFVLYLGSCQTAATFAATASTGRALGTAPSCPCRRRDGHPGWDSCDVIIVTESYVDHPSFGMAIIGAVLEAQGFRDGIIAQPGLDQRGRCSTPSGRRTVLRHYRRRQHGSMVNRTPPMTACEERPRYPRRFCSG